MTKSLQALVLSRLVALGTEEGPMSLRQATQRANGSLSTESLRKIARGEHPGRISDRTAEALAVALSVPIDEVYAAADVRPPLPRWELPPAFDRLALDDRRLVEDVARGLLRARGQRLETSAALSGPASIPVAGA